MEEDKHSKDIAEEGSPPSPPEPTPNPPASVSSKPIADGQKLMPNGMTKEEWLKIGEKYRFNASSAVDAGKASGEAKREKKKRQQNVQEVIQAMLSMPVRRGELKPMDEIESLDDYLEQGNVTVLEKALLNILKKTQSEGGSIIGLDAIIKWGGMMPAIKTEATVDATSKVEFVLKDPHADIDTMKADIQRIGDKHDIDIGDVDEIAKIKEY